MNGSAEFSADRIYRYSLSRDWRDLFSNSKPGYVAFCCLNPSTADETVDDPTIRRCIGFARAWGYGSMVMVNLFAIRATDPKVMLGTDAPVGPDNDAHLISHALKAALFICGWAAHGGHRDRANVVIRRIRTHTGATLLRLGDLTEGGFPRHPLYLRANLTPVPL